GVVGIEKAPRAVPGTAGIPQSYGDEIIVQPWNNPEVLERTIAERHHEIAAVITEPLMCNCGSVAAQEGSLRFVQAVTGKYGVLMILDEVMTGFRIGLGGAQAYYNITPDITTFAKAIACGYSMGAVGGKHEVMDLVASHQISHAGTYNGNVLGMCAVTTAI